jgi:hypothetical protein
MFYVLRVHRKIEKIPDWEGTFQTRAATNSQGFLKAVKGQRRISYADDSSDHIAL